MRAFPSAGDALHRASSLAGFATKLNLCSYHALLAAADDTTEADSAALRLLRSIRRGNPAGIIELPVHARAHAEHAYAGFSRRVAEQPVITNGFTPVLALSRRMLSKRDSSGCTALHYRRSRNRNAWNSIPWLAPRSLRVGLPAPVRRSTHLISLQRSIWCPRRAQDSGGA